LQKDILRFSRKKTTYCSAKSVNTVAMIAQLDFEIGSSNIICRRFFSF